MYQEDFLMFKQLFASSTIATLLLISGLSTTQAQGQEAPAAPPMTETPQVNVEDADLERFAAAMQQVQMIQQEAETKMAEAIEEQGLTVEQFKMMAQTQQNPQAETEMSSEEDEMFQQAAEEIVRIRQEATSEFETAVQEEGLEVEEFYTIAQAVQQDPSLQQRLMELTQE
jgi:hypothetical protein